MTGKRTQKRKPKYMEDIPVVGESFKMRDFLTFKKVKLSDKQEELSKIIKNNRIVVASGPAGTSKTFTACYTALQMFKDNLCERIVLCKPTEIVGDTDLGYLKGSLDDKLAVYKESFVSNFNEIIQDRDTELLMVDKKIEFKPVQYIRGSTFKNCIMIIDEYQSFSINQLMAIVTRLGENSKMVFIGDINQSDIDKKYIAVDVFNEVLDGIEGVEFFKFDRTDIVRDPMLIAITDKYDKMKAKGQTGINKGNK